MIYIYFEYNILCLFKKLDCKKYSLYEFMYANCTVAGYQLIPNQEQLAQ